LLECGGNKRERPEGIEGVWRGGVLPEAIVALRHPGIIKGGRSNAEASSRE